MILLIIPLIFIVGFAVIVIGNAFVKKQSTGQHFKNTPQNSNITKQDINQQNSKNRFSVSATRLGSTKLYNEWQPSTQVKVSEDQLYEAINNYEVLRIHYDGGSKPGIVRDILPKSVDGHLVKALCYNDNIEKHFKINKIYLAAGNANLPDKIQSGTQAEYTLKNIVDEHRLTWERQGWLIDSTENHIGLHQFSENGRVDMIATISLDYKKYFEVFDDEDESNEYATKARLRDRPWVLSGQKYRTNAFKHLSSAAEELRKLASLLAPNKI